ncbi:MAG: DUF502 domain-containing protein [Haloarculaceae archaeon]
MDPRATLKNSFVAGLILLAPLLVTVIALQVLLGWLRGLIGPVIDGTRLVAYIGDVELAAELLAIALVVVTIALVGYVAQRRLGTYLFEALDRFMGVIPVVSVVYSSVRQVSNALTSQRTRYESVALVEYPRTGLYGIGFVTAESPATVVDTLGESAVNVYLPNSPNPTNGQLLMVPESQIRELDMSVGRGIRLLVTTGIAEDERELQELKDQVEADFDTEDVDRGGEAAGPGDA